jgi:DNA-binding GntR family transcriptional regulator
VFTFAIHKEESRMLHGFHSAVDEATRQGDIRLDFKLILTGQPSRGKRTMNVTHDGSPKKTTSEALADLLRDEIVSGKVPAGSRITVADVASRYNVSQMPVREALQRLQGEGIVILLPHKGARVLSLDARFVNNMYDLRGAVESLLGRLALPNLTNAAMTRLEAIWQQIDQAAKNGDEKLLLALNGEFHRLLYRHANNPLALEIYNHYSGLMGTLRQKYGEGPGRLVEISAGLAELLLALRAQDAEQLSRLSLIICDQAKKDILNLMRQDHEIQTGNNPDLTTLRLLKSAAVESKKTDE